MVRWIEETPRDRALEVAVAHLKDGLSYRDLLAGLFLAGIRNIKPHPVGFKFHAVMVMNSAHLLGQTAAVPDRLLPMLWALDTFKKSQAQDIKEGDWTLGKVDEARLPGPGQAKAEFVRAMDAWDAEAADAAIAALCRTAGAAETMEPLWRIGVRDQRNIGHKPIFTDAELADPPGDRLAARRARPPLARLRPARPARRLAAASPSAPTRPTSRTPARSATTGRPASPTPPPPARCSRRSARRRPRRPRPRPSSS